MPVPFPEDQPDAFVPRGIGTQQFRHFRSGGGVVGQAELPVTVALGQYGIQGRAQKRGFGIPDRHEHGDFRPGAFHAQVLYAWAFSRGRILAQFQPGVIHGRRVIQRTGVKPRPGQGPQARSEQAVMKTPGPGPPGAGLIPEP